MTSHSLTKSFFSHTYTIVMVSAFDNLKEGIKKLLSITKKNEEGKNQIYKGWYNTLSQEA